MSLNSLTKLLVIILLPLLFIAVSCNKPTEPPPEKYNLEIIAADASCTEVWIDVKTPNTLLPQIFTLTENGEEKGSVTIDKADTTIVIENLLPKKSYKYQLKNNEHKSNQTEITTLDTTSHNFTWQTFEFGQHSSSVLYDVAIIDENNIWAVGVIYMNDSNGNPDPNFYNLIKWNGTEWKPERIYFINSQGQSFLAPMKSIFDFNANDIWIGLDQIITWDGNKYQSIEIPNTIFHSWINKMWGSSSNDLYVVGNSGSIAHWNGSSWKKIESGTDVDLKDICGTPDSKEIWACGWTSQNGRVAIVKISDTGVESIWDSQTNRTLDIYGGTLLNSLWANGNKEFVLVGGQVLRHSLLEKTIVRREWVPYLNGWKILELENYSYSIKGSSKNNIAVVGDAAMTWHYNGKSWHKFEEIYNLDNRLYGLAVTDNSIVSVGKSYGGGLGNALLIIGRR
ncbi:MAG: glucosyl transferase [Ignavibacteria bacterium]|nr:glucosyl transferase [Ignavibacteria bacterium]